MRFTQISTTRMLLRPLGAEHVDLVHALWTSPDVRRTLWDDRRIPRERTAAIIAQSAALYREHGLGWWGAWLHDGGAFVGCVGFWYMHEPPVLEIGYSIDPARWGRGLATEMAGGLIYYGFGALGLDQIRASLDTANRASARVLHKLGFAHERQTVVDDLDLSFYVLPRTEVVEA